ncbi:MAG: amidohydrolase family protein [Elusimicrobiota bacterium]|jgi:N-acyl-D-aspartate/D-glutamate deacylase|nr:amidohydrolase family protein [Elusimicrobiota bacterium]
MLDLLIKNAQIIDGSANAKPYIADIAIDNGTIIQISPLIKMSAKRVIDAKNEIVTPGFIDIHRHEDVFVFSKDYGEIQLRQGITTAISGNCGISIVPLPAKYKKEILNNRKAFLGILPENKVFESFADYFSVLEKEKLPINFGTLIGNASVHLAIKGFESGKLSSKEIVLAHKEIKKALQNGVFGISLGIFYPPENLYSFDDFIKVLEPIRNKNIPLIMHIRGEGDLLVSSVKEAISIAKELNVPLHISHYKCVGQRNWGHLLKEATKQIDDSIKSGMKITLDIYPWTAGATQLIKLLPPEFIKGTAEEIVSRLKEPSLRKKCKETLSKRQKHFDNIIDSIGWQNIVIASLQTENNQKFIGKRISEIAEISKKDPFDAAFDLLIEENCNIGIIIFLANKKDIDSIIKYPYSCIISDSIYPENGLTHPRQYATFTKFIAEFVRDRKVLTLPLAIHKITHLSAKILSISNKGLLKEGYDADICIFNIDKIESTANYLNPKVLGKGFSFVIVGGEIANENDTFKRTASGKVIYAKEPNL